MNSLQSAISRYKTCPEPTRWSAMNAIVSALSTAKIETAKLEDRLRRGDDMLTSRQRPFLATLSDGTQEWGVKYPNDLMEHYEGLIRDYEAWHDAMREAWHLIATEDVDRADNSQHDAERSAAQGHGDPPALVAEHGVEKRGPVSRGRRNLGKGDGMERLPHLELDALPRGVPGPDGVER